MKIKYKIALLFTLLVSLILLLLGTSIFYASFINRRSEFAQRLRNRALTSARLFINLNEIDKTLLKKVDSLNMNILTEERICVYNDNNELLYINNSELDDPLKINSSTLDLVRKEKEYNFRIGKYEGIGAVYQQGDNKFVVISTAVDQIGRQENNELKQLLFIGGLAGLIVAALAGYFFSINLLRPINRIIKEMNETSLQNISKRIPVKQTKDELTQLASTFNSLLERLEDAFYNQKRFISNASHELSTPLTSISSQLEVALMQNRSDKEYKAVMVSVQEDVIHLNNLIRKLLELAKAGAGKGISLTQVRVDEIVIKAGEEIKSLYKEYHVNCSFEEIPGDESLCYTFGNEELLFIAFKNIIENACKYSPAHQAWISLKFLPDKKIIHIKDKGIGMTKEDMKKILEPFFRSQNAEFFSDGFGLGLAMSSQIIRLHKGKIEIESEPGKGSTFTIILPVN